MSTNNDGGPAFPIPSVGTGDPRDGMTTGSPGMSLRDWFAGQALAGWLASFRQGDSVKQDKCAEFAYDMADAMLAAREKGVK